MKKVIFISFLLLSFTCLYSQNIQQGFEWRNIGPANQGGRIVDIEALDNDFKQVIMTTGSGGVWKSDNAGTTWTPIFDKYETASIGDIARSQTNPDLIWVGTGEANNRNSVSWGNGIYKSIDGGKTFENKGLESTHQIARVVINPENDEEVCVCAVGHLWGYSGERGLQKKNIDLKTTTGIQRYYWDRTFDIKAFTEEELKEIDKLFLHLIEIYGFSSLKRHHASFKKAKTPREQREVLEKLTVGYLSLNIDEKYLIPRAEAGSYQIELIVDGKRLVNTLEIKNDPMLD